MHTHSTTLPGTAVIVHTHGRNWGCMVEGQAGTTADHAAAGASGGGRAVTSRDVASLAGVSQATVSRVLNDSANVTPRLRGRVLRALDQTGYRPNALAQAMKTGRTGTIGVVIAGIANPFYPELLGTIGRQLAAAGHRMILWETECAGEQSAIEAIQQGLVDGVMFTTVMPGAAAVAEASRRGAPMVLFDRTLPGIRCDRVSSDNIDGAALAGRHEVNGGHRRVGFIAGTPDASTAAGVIDELLVAPGDFSHAAGRDGLATMLAAADPPDGHRGRQRRHRVRRAGRGPCPWRGRA